MVDRSNDSSGGDRASRKDDAHRVPFDTSDLRKLQYPTENDPPYRPFWIEEPRK